MLYQKYQVAHNLQEALFSLSNPDMAKVRLVAGGTDLMLQLHEKLVSADVLIDINHVPELCGIRLAKHNGADDTLIIGAATHFVELAQSSLIREHAKLLAEASKKIGAAQIQNMGTLGGNIANASPAGDAIPCLYALDARVVVCGLTGERVIPIADFYQGYRKIDLAAGELITEIRIPLPGDPHCRTGTAFEKFALRKSQAIAVVNAAVVIIMKNGKIDTARVALGAVGPTIIRSPLAEHCLLGQTPTDELFAKAAEAARLDARPIDDVRGSASFRKQLIGVCVQRALKTAHNRCL